MKGKLMRRRHKPYRIMTRQMVTRIYEVSAINEDKAMNKAIDETAPKFLNTGNEELVSIDVVQPKTET